MAESAGRALSSDEELGALRAGERHVADRGGDAAGSVELRRLAMTERARGIEDDARHHVLLGTEELEHWLSGAGVRGPVHAAEIIARRVRAVLLELSGAAATLREVLARGAGAGADLEPPPEHLELSDEVGAEQIRAGR